MTQTHCIGTGCLPPDLLPWLLRVLPSRSTKPSCASSHFANESLPPALSRTSVHSHAKHCLAKLSDSRHALASSGPGASSAAHLAATIQSCAVQPRATWPLSTTRRR